MLQPEERAGRETGESLGCSCCVRRAQGGSWGTASHPGCGQVLPALALLLPEDLLTSILGLQYLFFTPSHGGGQEPVLQNLPA